MAFSLVGRPSMKALASSSCGERRKWKHKMKYEIIKSCQHKKQVIWYSNRSSGTWSKSEGRKCRGTNWKVNNEGSGKLEKRLGETFMNFKKQFRDVSTWLRKKKHPSNFINFILLKSQEASPIKSSSTSFNKSDVIVVGKLNLAGDYLN